MYHYLIQRQRDIVAQCVELLNEHCRDMALDPRFYHRIGYASGPGSHSSVSTSGLSGVTGITTPTSASTAASCPVSTSSASSPSLRARESVAVPFNYQDGAASTSPGGNVRVVVRVRKFLPRGILYLGQGTIEVADNKQK